MEKIENFQDAKTKLFNQFNHASALYRQLVYDLACECQPIGTNYTMVRKRNSLMQTAKKAILFVKTYIENSNNTRLEERLTLEKMTNDLACCMEYLEQQLVLEFKIYNVRFKYKFKTSHLLFELNQHSHGVMILSVQIHLAEHRQHKDDIEDLLFQKLLRQIDKIYRLTMSMSNFKLKDFKPENLKREIQNDLSNISLERAYLDQIYQERNQESATLFLQILNL
ncbi:hypothetical protein HELRODRAFT_165313 [Helobdella robusta]|uniref:Uncharacterized protein n=1 Tax=Helobdella robusta TaxID=6412 RepID=T1EWL0_HELRO|nr:hypothetical protein HELRODRAFT_165313 [Helobdella robusta]ESN91304.1 hypothetical protein HELRODRAFT_165313 [Helobdella robusta]